MTWPKRLRAWRRRRRRVATFDSEIVDRILRLRCPSCTRGLVDCVCH